MGLVDYNSDSDSGSGDDSPAVPAPAPKPPTKKPFQKLASSGGKILVSLPTTTTTDTTPSDEPPAKRAKISTTGGRFSNFSSFLPPPTKTAKPVASLGASKSAPRPGVHLSFKTSSEAAFSRDIGGNGDGDTGGSSGGGLGLLAPKAPSVPEGQRPAEEVKLVGKATMFRPLSVARKPAKKKAVKAPAKAVGEVAAAAPVAVAQAPVAVEAPVQKKEKVSLFSFGTGESEGPEADIPDSLAAAGYEPVSAAPLNSYDDPTAGVTGPYDPSDTFSSTPQPQHSIPQHPESLNTIADDLNLSAAARRELFGRSGKPSASTKGGNVLNFSMDREYAANEALRASGEAVQHNPVRAIQPGKHSLKQIINTVQSQESALEDNFAKNRATQREAGSRYGWR